jgi:predicted house-cleaning noncanonical NTP pyrophosphatase (MazG superfamily)
MRAQAEAFARQGLPDHDLAFLPAYLVPARASVMAHARPGAQRTQVDALWGFPDGVGLLPHDSWFHDVVRDRLTEHVTYKGVCLTYDEASGWEFAPVPEPFDWGHVLNNEEVRTASSWARRLADHRQCEVQLMVLARIDGQRGPSAMMPWHFTDHEVPGADAPVRSVPGSRILLISRPADIPSAIPQDIVGLHLRPAIDTRRDPDFLTKVGEAAASAGVPIYFEGSVLGHPFYLLRAAGAPVVPVGGADPESEPYDYNKLVRDRIPEIARRSGSSVRVLHAAAAEADVLLRHKVLEEAFEIFKADDDGLVGELADLYEVLAALQAHTGISDDQVAAAREKKAAARGTFSTLAYLEASGSGIRVGSGRSSTSLFGEPSTDATSPPQSSESPLQVERIDDATMTFRIPLVPPLRRAVPLRQYDVRVEGVRVTFTYAGAQLGIKFEDLARRMLPGQLSLGVEPT